MGAIEKKTIKEAHEYMKRYPNERFECSLVDGKIRIMKSSDHKKEETLFKNSLVLGLILGVAGNFLVEFLIKFLEKKFELNATFYSIGLIAWIFVVCILVKIVYKNLEIPV